MTNGHSLEDYDTGDWENPSPELLSAFEEIKKDFTIDATKLKEITARFQEELQDGLDKHNTNIVRTGI